MACSSDEDENDSTDIRTSSSNRKYYPSILPNLASPIESTSTTSYPINEESALNILETNSSIPCRSESSRTQQNRNEHNHALLIECNHHISGKVKISISNKCKCCIFRLKMRGYRECWTQKVIWMGWQHRNALWHFHNC